MIQEERIYDFLAGLNSEYDPVRVQILGKDYLSLVRKVFSSNARNHSCHSKNNVVSKITIGFVIDYY